MQERASDDVADGPEEHGGVRLVVTQEPLRSLPLHTVPPSAKAIPVTRTRRETKVGAPRPRVVRVPALPAVALRRTRSGRSSPRGSSQEPADSREFFLTHTFASTFIGLIAFKWMRRRRVEQEKNELRCNDWVVPRFDYKAHIAPAPYFQDDFLAEGALLAVAGLLSPRAPVPPWDGFAGFFACFFLAWAFLARFMLTLSLS